MPFKSERASDAPPRFVTPLLAVGSWYEYDTPQQAFDIIIDGLVAVVENDEDAAEVLALLGLDKCCIADRLSVSHGGPVLCTH